MAGQALAAAEKKPVTRVSAPLLQRSAGCSACAEEEDRLRRKPDGSASTTMAVPPIVHEVLNTPGQLLDAATRAFMEPRFGQDFSQVRVHNDTRAAESARSVRALAYTVGKDIVFGAGQYAPGSEEGRKLVAHELVHVQQQFHASRPVGAALVVGESHDALEQQADAAARAIEHHQPASISRSHLQVSRQEDTGDLTGGDTGVDTSLTLGTGGGGGGGGASRPVFFCSKSVAAGGKHAFFRVGGSGTGNSTFELEHDELGDHCKCGIQGLPVRDYPEDFNSADATCVAAPGVTEACLLANWSSYPVGQYCALGPNSNTYAGTLARTCGAGGVRPPGWLPGFDDPPPAAGTATSALDARLTFLPGFCKKINCDDISCTTRFY